MNTIIVAISFPYRLLIIFGGVFVSMLLTSYSMYKKHIQIIKEQEATINDLQIRLSGRADIKQEIRSFLEFLNPKILLRIDEGQKEIPIHVTPRQGYELMKLSEKSDFDRYLDFEDSGGVEYTEQGKKTIYYLYFKDALMEKENQQ